MSDSIRTFVAVNVDPLPELLTVLKSLAAMRWPIVAVPPDKLHVTLKFLGETSLRMCAAIPHQIVQAVSGRPPIRLRVARLGAFPTVARPSVVWAGLVDAEPLAEIAERLEGLLEPLGFTRESRPFHPHLTLARIKGRPPRDLFDVLRHHAETCFGSMEVRSVEFIRSDRQRGGARYSTLASCELV
jgi:2'-5' RNA ligase